MADEDLQQLKVKIKRKIDTIKRFFIEKNAYLLH